MKNVLYHFKIKFAYSTSSCLGGHSQTKLTRIWLDPLHPFVYTLSFKSWHFLTTYPALLVNVVCERPSKKTEILVHFCYRCVLGDGVQIQDNTQLPPETWLVSQKPDSGFSDDEEETENDNDTIYGAKAIVFKEEDEDDDEDSDNEIEGITYIFKLQFNFVSLSF